MALRFDSVSSLFFATMMNLRSSFYLSLVVLLSAPALHSTCAEEHNETPKGTPTGVIGELGLLLLYRRGEFRISNRILRHSRKVSYIHRMTSINYFRLKTDCFDLSFPALSNVCIKVRARVCVQRHFHPDDGQPLNYIHHIMTYYLYSLFKTKWRMF